MEGEDGRNTDMHPTDITTDQFDACVEAAMARMPVWVRPMLEEIAITVEDAPVPGQTPPGTLLLGLYRGFPRTRYGGRPPGSMPDTIVLYRDSILAVCRGPADVGEAVFRVLGHEVGHAMGLSDARLHELGW